MTSHLNTKQVDAILLPVDSSNPCLIKLDYEVTQDHDFEPSLERHSIIDSLAKYMDSPYPMPIGRWGYNGCSGSCDGKDYTLTLFLGDTSSIDGSPLNRCCEALEGMGRFGGNVIVVRSIEPQEALIQFTDASMDDVPGIADFLKLYFAHWRKWDSVPNPGVMTGVEFEQWWQQNFS